MAIIKGWRKTGKNWAKGTIILNISNKFKINNIVGYNVDKYDFSKRGTLLGQKRILGTFKTKAEARQFVGAYMRTH